MTGREFTPDQLRALEWLPSDGSWKSSRDHELELTTREGCWHLCSEDLAEIKGWEDGWRRADANVFRLTPAGIAAKRELEKTK